MLPADLDRAEILLEALPYIRRFHGQTILIKYGGSLMIHDDLKRKFANDIVLLKYIGLNPVIVHGGGKEISKWMKKVGKEAVFIDGYRVTDSETMELTEMVLSGKINSDVVSLINYHGGKAVGLSGKDANLFVAKKRERPDKQDLGFVGDIEYVDTGLLETLAGKGYIPVISSIGVSRSGETLNMNADHVAEGIAIALKALKLLFLTDVKGLLVDDVLQQRLTLEKAESLLAHPDVQGGMLPKLTCSINALKGGVSQVHMIDGTVAHSVLLELLTDGGIGTMISMNGIAQ